MDLTIIIKLKKIDLKNPHTWNQDKIAPNLNRNYNCKMPEKN